MVAWRLFGFWLCVHSKPFQTQSMWAQGRKRAEWDHFTLTAGRWPKTWEGGSGPGWNLQGHLLCFTVEAQKPAVIHSRSEDQRKSQLWLEPRQPNSISHALFPIFPPGGVFLLLLLLFFYSFISPNPLDLHGNPRNWTGQELSLPFYIRGNWGPDCFLH